MSQLERFFVRITQRLYTDYTGQLGAYVFKDGVSVDKMHRNDAVNVSHGFECEALDDDGEVLFPIVSGKIPTDEELQTARSARRAPEKPAPKAEKAVAVKDEPAKAEEPEQSESQPVEKFTREQLEAIADKQGLRGLREVAVKVGAKAKSIPALIDKILEKQG